MRKMLIAVSTFMLMTMVSTTQLKASFSISIKEASSTKTKTTKLSKQSAILARVYEIKKMDKSNFTVLERNVLRTELKSLKKSYRDSGGVYISVGGLIIIILLLILILK